MSPESNMNETELLKSMKPIMVHSSWDYFEEYIRRLRNRNLELLVRERDEVAIHRLQGQVEGLSTLLALKNGVMEM